MDFLKYDYYLNAHRWFGNAHFDVEIIYDVADAHSLLTLLAVPAKRLLFLSNAAMSKLADGDEFFLKAVLFAAKHCMAVFVSNELAKMEAEQLLPKGTAINVIENASQLRELLERKEFSVR
jgi:hypothetical protein